MKHIAAIVTMNVEKCTLPAAFIFLNTSGRANLYPTINKIAAKVPEGRNHLQYSRD